MQHTVLPLTGGIAMKHPDRNSFFYVKDMGLSTGGVLIAVLNNHDATHFDVRALDRILIRAGRKKTVAVVDISESEKNIPRGTVGLFEEVLAKLGISHGARVVLDYAKKPASIDCIKKKLDGRPLSREETYAIVKDIVRDELTSDELSYYVSACYTRGMTLQEATDLTRATVDLGQKLNIPSKIILDKHCVGGVPNNRTTLIVVPILVAAGFTVPKTSSRSITSPSGTADTMEALAPVMIPASKMESIAKTVGGFIAWGGAVSLASADDKLIKVRHTLSLDPEGMLLASIMAKKAAVKATHVLIDIPVGKDTKVTTHAEALHLERQFYKIGKRLGMHIRVMISRGEEPVGNGIGPCLEARDALWILQQHPMRPKDLERKSIHMAGMLLNMAGVNNGESKAREILESGKAYRAMRRIIKAQGGDPNIKPDQLSIGPYSITFHAPSSGKIIDLNTRLISHVSRIAGAPVDKGAGMYLNIHEGSIVKKGDPLLTLYAHSEKKLHFAKEEYKKERVVEIR